MPAWFWLLSADSADHRLEPRSGQTWLDRGSMAGRMRGLQIQRAILWYGSLYPTLMVWGGGHSSFLARLGRAAMGNGEVEAGKTRAAGHGEEEGRREDMWRGLTPWDGRWLCSTALKCNFNQEDGHPVFLCFSPTLTAMAFPVGNPLALVLSRKHERTGMIFISR